MSLNDIIKIFYYKFKIFSHLFLSYEISRFQMIDLLLNALHIETM